MSDPGMPESVIVSVRKSDSPEPVVPSTEEDCSRCGETVWVSHGTMKGAKQEFPTIVAVCIQCITKMLEEQAGDPTECASCGSTDIYQESAAEGWSCRGCGANDADE